MAEIKSRYESKGLELKKPLPVISASARRAAAKAEAAENEKGFVARARARAASALRQLPGASVVEDGLQRAERTVLRELKSRLDQAMGDPLPATPKTGATEQKISRTYVVPLPEPAPRALADLLARAANQTEEQAQALFFSRLLAQLVPDEALILSNLADGKPQAIVNITLTPLLGSAYRNVVDNLSLIGTRAKVAWTAHTPWYLTHLLQLGILETGPESRGMDNAYAALESGADARNRISAAQETGSRLSPRYTRRTVRMSPLGKALWEACKSDISAIV